MGCYICLGAAEPYLDLVGFWSGFGWVWVGFGLGLGLGQVWVKFQSFSGRVRVDPRSRHAHCIAYAHLVPRPLFFTVVTVVVA